MGLRRFTYDWINRSLATAMRRAGLERFGEHVIHTRSLNVNSMVVDLGANRGAFYSGVIRKTGASCCAVEALAELCAELPQLPGVRRFNLAISRRNETVRLCISGNSEANSLQPQIAERYGLKGEVEVKGCTLESFLAEAGVERLDLLKVDIEGTEIAMFDSTSDATLSKIGQIAAEFHDFINPGDLPQVKAIVRRVRRLGFIVLVFSSGDWREVLMLNSKRLPLNRSQRIWIRTSSLLIALKRGRFAISRLMRRNNPIN